MNNLQKKSEGRDKHVSEGEKKLRRVLQEAPSIFLILEGPDMVITFGNKPLLASWGKDDSIIGKRILDVLPEIKDQPFPKLLEKVYQTGKSHIGAEEKAVILKDGQMIDRYYSYVYQPIHEEDGTTTGIMVMANDITNQVLARKAAEESRARLQLITDAVPSLVSYVDKEKRYTFNNYMYEKWFGHARDELKNQYMWDVLGQKAYEGIREHVERALAGEAVHFERLLPYKDGGDRYVSIDYVPDLSEGKVLGFYAIINDISERKKFEDELEQKVLERTKDIHKANLQLEKMNKELSSFAYISSHDLQEPLRKIQMFSKRLEEKEFQALSEEGKSYLQRMDSAAARMQQLINDLLEYSRTNTDSKHFEVTDLNALLEDVKSDLKEKITVSNATIVSSGLPSLNVIRFQMRQLFNNLISNSIKFARKGVPPVITIEYAKLMAAQSEELGFERGHRISLSDNGIGFNKQFSSQIFEVFQRLHGRDEFEGTGIGLSIVKRIAENHFGVITAEGKDGAGATFHLYLPE